MSKAVSLVGLVLTFAVAYGCQRLTAYLKTEMAEALEAEPVFWFDSFALVIVSAALLFLSWYVIYRARKDVWVAAVFVLAGVGVTFAWAFEMTLGTTLISRMPNAEYLMPYSYVRYAAAFVAVIGIASLVIPRRLRR